MCFESKFFAFLFPPVTCRLPFLLLFIIFSTSPDVSPSSHDFSFFLHPDGDFTLHHPAWFLYFPWNPITAQTFLYTFSALFWTAWPFEINHFLPPRNVGNLIVYSVKTRKAKPSTLKFCRLLVIARRLMEVMPRSVIKIEQIFGGT